MPLGSGRFGLSGGADELIPTDIGVDPARIYHATSWDTSNNQWDDHLGNSTSQIVDGTPTYAAAVTDTPYGSASALTLPAVRFDATSDGWECANLQVNVGNTSLFWVSRWGEGVTNSSVSGEGSPIRAYESGGKTSYFGHKGFTTGRCRVMNTEVEAEGTPPTLSSTSSGGKWLVHGFRSSSSDQAEAAYIWRSRNALGLTTDITKADTNSGDSGYGGPMTINKGTEFNGYSRSAVDIYGIWQYTSGLSDTQMTNIVLYLSNLIGQD